MNKCTVCGEHISAGTSCDVCVTSLTRTLSGFPVLYVQLHRYFTAIGDKPRTEIGFDRKEWKYRNPPTILRMALISQAERCVQVVHNWAIYSVPCAIPRNAVRPGFLLQRLCVALSRDVPGALSTCEEGERANAVQHLYMECKLQLSGEEKIAGKVASPCPACNLRSLERTVGNHLSCRSCGESVFPTFENPT